MFTTAVRGSYPKHPSPPRPSLLFNAISKWRSGMLEDKDLERSFQRSIIEAMAEMVVAGVEVAWDGQIRWDGPADFIFRKLGGVSVGPDRLKGEQRTKLDEDSGITPENSASGHSGNGHESGLLSTQVHPIATGKVEWVKPILVDDYRFIAERSPVDLRPVLTGPYTLASLCDQGTYAGKPGDLILDIARALNRELEGLQSAGAGFFLIEEPLFSSASPDSEAFFKATELLCRGIEKRVFIAPGGSCIGLEDQLARSPFGGFVFDLAESPENLSLISTQNRFEGKVIELGLVSGRSRKLEIAEEVATKLIELSDFHDPNLLWVGCSSGMGSLTRELAFEKLKVNYRAAELARRELARRERPADNG